MLSASTIDVTLLQGLEPAMSTEEQATITAMMISGDPNELAKAAKIIYDLGLLLEQGVLPHQRSEEHSLRLQESFRTQIVSRRRRPPAYNDRELRVAQEKKENDEESLARARALPLPVRMPRFIQINSFDPDGTPVERKKFLGVIGREGTRTLPASATFVDHPWDGTLGAAFTKLNVNAAKTGHVQRNETETGPKWIIDQELNPSPGFDEIVLGMENGYAARLIADGLEECRVVVAQARNDAAKLGLHRGDVVTHVNGEEFTGTAEELDLLIKHHYATEAEHLELVVNAEPCIAEALKLRAWNHIV